MTTSAGAAAAALDRRVEVGGARTYPSGRTPAFPASPRRRLGPDRCPRRRRWGATKRTVLAAVCQPDRRQGNEGDHAGHHQAAAIPIVESQRLLRFMSVGAGVRRPDAAILVVEQRTPGALPRPSSNTCAPPEPREARRAGPRRAATRRAGWAGRGGDGRQIRAVRLDQQAVLRAQTWLRRGRHRRP